MEYMQFFIENHPGRYDGQRVLAVHGELTRETRSEFEDFVRAVDAHVVILDLSVVPYVDSDGLGAIIKAYVSCARSGRQLALAAGPERLRMLFKVTGMQQVIPIFSSVEQAQESLRK